MERLQEAIGLAVKHHAFQYRKQHNTAGNKIPFIVHPMQVMKVVFDWGAGTPTNLCAAICHDILEDTEILPGELREVIGDESYEIVEELTFVAERNDKSIPTGLKAELKHAYLQTFATKSLNAIIIKVADRACNVQDFINGGEGEYAGAYAKKAWPLYRTVESRIAEVVAVYGYDCARKMEHVVRELQIASIGA